MTGNTWYKPEWREILRATGFSCVGFTFAFVCMVYSFGWDIVKTAAPIPAAMYTLFGCVCLMARKTLGEESK